jgi:hypothetical protein
MTSCIGKFGLAIVLGTECNVHVCSFKADYDSWNEPRVVNYFAARLLASSNDSGR